MIFKRKKAIPVESPVLVVDALGIATQIRDCDATGLMELSERLDGQYHGFRAMIPFRFVATGPKWVIGSSEFDTFRLNDMFVLFATKAHPDAIHRHALAASLLYHALLTKGFIPRGGLGFGLVLRGQESILGSGFIDAYAEAEKRKDPTRNVCAIQVSNEFIARVPNSKMTRSLLCVYEQRFFLNPRALIDPDMGEFNNGRILGLLKSAGANSEKLDATSRFLNEFQDYKAIDQPDPHSLAFVHSWLGDQDKK
jgi:hypothetical protein